MAKRPRPGIDTPLAEFRKQLAILKKAKLLPYNVDVRRAEPSPMMRAAVRKYESTIKQIQRGQATVVPVKGLKYSARDLRAQHVTTVSAGLKDEQRAIITHFAGETVKVRGGVIDIESIEGIRRIPLPGDLRTDTISHFYSDLRKTVGKEYLKRPGIKYGIRFHNQRTLLYDSVRDVINAVSSYDATVDAGRSRKQKNELIANFEIFEIKDDPKDTIEWLTRVKRAATRRKMESRKKSKRRK